MRLFIIALPAYLLALAPASALEAGDTMRAWAGAPAGDRDRLLDQMGGASLPAVSKPTVRTCLDEAAKLTAHGDLPIGAIFKACAAQAQGESV